MTLNQHPGTPRAGPGVGAGTPCLCAYRATEGRAALRHPVPRLVMAQFVAACALYLRHKLCKSPVSSNHHAVAKLPYQGNTWEHCSRFVETWPGHPGHGLDILDSLDILDGDFPAQTQIPRILEAVKSKINQHMLKKMFISQIFNHFNTK